MLTTTIMLTGVELMARRKVINHVTFYRVIHDLARVPEFTAETVLDRWYDYSPYTVPTKMMIAAALRRQPMIYIVTPHHKQTRKIGQGNLTGNKRPQTYGVCDQWIADNPLDEILKKSNRGRVDL